MRHVGGLRMVKEQDWGLDIESAPPYIFLDQKPEDILAKVITVNLQQSTTMNLTGVSSTTMTDGGSKASQGIKWFSIFIPAGRAT